MLSFWPFMPLAARAPLYGRLLVELMRDGRVPASRKVLLGVAAAYVVSPIDLIPDFIPVISRLDDSAAIVIALDLLLEGVPREVMIEKMYSWVSMGGSWNGTWHPVRRFLPAPIRRRHCSCRSPSTACAAVVRSGSTNIGPPPAQGGAPRVKVILTQDVCRSARAVT